MKWTERQKRLAWERFAEALRECGILWLIFAMLDRLLSGTLTWSWGLTNSAAALALWLYGTYIEIKWIRE